MLNGTPNEPCCPHCLFGPCIIRRPPVFLTGRAVPSLANDRKRYKLYQQFWKLLKDLGLWDHPTYLARKGLVTHPLDRREIMPKCVQVHEGSSAELLRYRSCTYTFGISNTSNFNHYKMPHFLKDACYSYVSLYQMFVQ